MRHFFERLFQSGGDARRLGNAKIAAIGPTTADELRRYGLLADVVPGEFRAEALADALSGDAAGRRFLLIRASRGREVLTEQLSAAGGRVDQVVAYSSEDVAQADETIASRLAAGTIDWGHGHEFLDRPIACKNFSATISAARRSPASAR